MSNAVTVERLLEGRPLISPTPNVWEAGVTFNSAALFIEPTPEYIPTFRALLGDGAEKQYPEGIVVLHYRARPDIDPGRPLTRSYVGISIHRPDLSLIKRLGEPVLEPGGSVCDCDYLGAEDPRITRLDGAWWMVYCGVAPVQPPNPQEPWRGSVCIARSDDLLHWAKCGAAIGTGDSFASRTAEGVDVAPVSNKDGVLFPDRIGGKVYMLHRPMRGPMREWGTSLAVADQPDGPFEDLGQIHQAVPTDGWSFWWAGAGAVPIRIGDGRYVSIEHTGNSNDTPERKYVLDAFLYDFNNFDPSKPESLMKARIDNIMQPETDCELNGPHHDSVANVVFSCGAYVHEKWLYIVYGGGDTVTLAARTDFEALVKELEQRL